VIVQVKWIKGLKIGVLSTNISLYFENDTRYSHSYYGRRIGNLIKWCHFQWPWVTPNLDFKVPILFNVK